MDKMLIDKKCSYVDSSLGSLEVQNSQVSAASYIDFLVDSNKVK